MSQRDRERDGEERDWYCIARKRERGTSLSVGRTRARRRKSEGLTNGSKQDLERKVDFGRNKL
jgi:hypothetical protein